MDNDTRIYDISKTCDRLFVEILSKLDAASALVAEVLHQRFKQWASFLGVFAPENVSLDTRLRYSESISQLVLQYLQIASRNLDRICKLDQVPIEKDFTPEDLQRSVAEEVDHTLESDASSPLVESLRALKRAIDGLYRLGVAIRQSSSATLNRRIGNFARENDDMPIESVVFLRLKHKFFDKDDENINSKSPLSLCRQLATSISFRYFQLLYRQSRLERIGKNRESVSVQPQGVKETTDENPRENIPPQKPTKAKKKGDSNELKKLAVGNAGMKQQWEKSESAPTTVNTEKVLQKYAASEISFAVPKSVMSTHLRDAKYPDLPKVDPVTREARCLFCGRPIFEMDLKKKGWWHHHLDQDLKLYTCLAETCVEPPQLFSQFHEWSQHMDEHHSINWMEEIHKPLGWCCAVEHNDLYFDDEGKYDRHVQETHPEYEAEKAELKEWSELQRERPPYTCPICNCVPEDLAVIVPWLREGNLDKPAAIGTEAAARAQAEREKAARGKLLLHIGTHLKQLGLMSVAYFGDDADGNSMGSKRGSIPIDKDGNVHLIENLPDYFDRQFEGYVMPKGPELLGDSVDWSDVKNFDVENGFTADSQDPILQHFRSHQPPPSVSSEDGQPSRMRIIVAVDFGTIFSSVAYGSTLEPRRQKLLSHWGNGGEMVEDRVPTILGYDNKGTSGAYSWGFRAQEFALQGKRIQESFKLGLCNDFEERRARESELMRKYKSQTALPEVKGEECENLVVDYLSGIKEAVDKYFNDAFDDTVVRYPRDYIVTVPACWDHAEQEKIRRCAERADMGKGSNLRMIANPEAACIYAVQESISAKVGDTYVICDAGGGTVELSSYTINSMEKGQKTTHCQLAEAAKSTGGFCGTEFLNRIFETYIETKLRNYRHWKPCYMLDATRIFKERIKPHFTGEKDRDEYIRIQGLVASRDHGIEDNYMVLTTAELREHVFDEVIQKVRHLVRDQIINTSRHVTAVWLAGGFGKNPYLKTRLEQLDVVSQNGTKVMVIENRFAIQNVDQIHVDLTVFSDTAIARGALIAGLAGIHKSANEHNDTFDICDIDRTEVVSRLAKRHYGIVSNFPFVEGKDPENRRLQRDDGDKIQKIAWFAKIGDEISESQPVLFHFSKLAKVKAGIPAHEACAPVVHIYGCEMGITPLYKEHDVVREIATLEIDLEGMDIPIRWIRGSQFYEVRFDVEMKLYSASVSFWAVYTDGQEVKRFEVKNVQFY